MRTKTSMSGRFGQSAWAEPAKNGLICEITISIPTPLRSPVRTGCGANLMIRVMPTRPNRICHSPARNRQSVTAVTIVAGCPASAGSVISVLVSPACTSAMLTRLVVTIYEDVATMAAIMPTMAPPYRPAAAPIATKSGPSGANTRSPQAKESGRQTRLDISPAPISDRQSIDCSATGGAADTEKNLVAGLVESHIIINECRGDAIEPVCWVGLRVLARIAQKRSRFCHASRWTAALRAKSMRFCDTARCNRLRKRSN